MATERQIAANLANSALSTGPKSIEGKAISRLNAALLLNLRSLGRFSIKTGPFASSRPDSIKIYT
jgi:hypothetical protein